ncbi:hypothetical protein BGZ83_006844 [Gryganskiella cystojenkinii]|nr:hypothetical protein BGZ83_006844 [Gryganskiella cystojenkinii]
MVHTTDKTKLIIFDTLNRFLSTYTIATNQWVNTPIPPILSSFQVGTEAVLDPDSSKVYILNGKPTTAVNMVVYDITAGQATFTSTPTPSSNTNMQSYSGVWSTFRKSMVIYGGILGTSASSSTTVATLVEYEPAIDTWSGILEATGASPGIRSCHCMVSAYGGTKMVVFGGLDASNSVSGAIFVLDLASMNWIAGNPAPSPRYDMACAVAGDSFLAYGGSGVGISNAPIIIYNLRTNQWVNQFDPTGTSTPSPSSSPGSNSSSTTDGSSLSSHGSSIGPIAGGIGAIVVLAAIGTFLFFRRRKTRQLVPKENNEVDSPSKVETNLHELRRDLSPPSPRKKSKWVEHDSPSSPGRSVTGSKTELVGRSPNHQDIYEINAEYGADPYSSAPPVLSPSYPQKSPASWYPSPPHPQPHEPQSYTSPRPWGSGTSTMPRSPQSGSMAFNADWGAVRSPQSVQDSPQQSLAGASPLVQHSGYEDISLSRWDSKATLTSATTLSDNVESRTDLVKRQLALKQVQHELNMEALRVEEELRMRQM